MKYNFDKLEPNPFPIGTFKHDFIEWWNVYVSRGDFVRNNSLPIILAEAAEIAHTAGIYGSPPKPHNEDVRE